MRGEVNGPMPERFDTVSRWGAYTTHRDPVLGIFAGYEVPNAKDPEDRVWGNRTIDPRSGAALPDDQLKIGSQFFYPLHYSLNLHWMDLGYWIVGLVGLVMLAALVSGVVMHRKVFREFFTFRPKKATQRSTLDLHNMTGVLALPFHFFFAFTGMVIAALTILIANRLLPATLPAGWPQGLQNRGDVEQYIFWAGWALAMAHAFWRSAPVAQGRMNPAWREQCWAVAAMAAMAVVLNGITTGDHLFKTLGEGYWPVAGVDLSLLVTAVLGTLAARKLHRQAAAAAAAPARRVEAAHA